MDRANKEPIIFAQYYSIYFVLKERYIGPEITLNRDGYGSNKMAYTLQSDMFGCAM